MIGKKYKVLLYVIATTIVLTIVVQCYWNYKNYLQNKQYFINQVQISLDNALENYYANLAEDNQMAFVNIDSDSLNPDIHFDQFKPDSVFWAIDQKLRNPTGKQIKEITQILDSITNSTYLDPDSKMAQVKVIKGQNVKDSIGLLRGITSIYISIRDDSLNFSKLNPLLKTEFERKKLIVPYALKHFKNDSLINSYNEKIVKPNFLKTTSKTKFLRENEILELAYPNATKIILKQGISGILLSLILSITIISCLFYLLKVIKHQKQLAEVKNDLISNITHEFKTPISTIGVALESIKDFNVIDNKEKTKSYLDMSAAQLKKLNIMVEKLLETATLDSESLELRKERTDIVDLIRSLVNKHNMAISGSPIRFSAAKEPIIINVDLFHFENAINNVIDNAVKYGGNDIRVDLSSNNDQLEILISDNGISLTMANKDEIFEKFYRVQNGNTHDVKGFGIGLYYTKKIMEKHNGSITLDLGKNLTTFKIILPNE